MWVVWWKEATSSTSINGSEHCLESINWFLFEIWVKCNKKEGGLIQEVGMHNRRNEAGLVCSDNLLILFHTKQKLWG